MVECTRRNPGGTGRMAEWFKAPVLKTGVGQLTVGSNPSPSAGLTREYWGGARVVEWGRLLSGCRDHKSRPRVRIPPSPLKSLFDRGPHRGILFESRPPRWNNHSTAGSRHLHLTSLKG